MRKMLTLLIAVFCALNVHAVEKPKEIYLLIGQSNMAGRAAVTPELAGELKGAWLLNDKGEWEAAKNPLNRYSTIRKGLGAQKLGPGYGFAQELLRLRPEVAIGLVVNAKGGSKIEVWTKGGKFFNDAVTRTKQAMAAGGELKGICWHQGESNASDPAYLEKATDLIAAFREAFDNENLPFVVGETCKAQSDRAVNAQLNELAASVPHTACVKSDGLMAFDGNTHFDTAAQLELGKRYASEMLRLLQQR